MYHKRAITAESKREFIEIVLNKWLENNELRFGQLIDNNIKDCDLFYVEDEDFIRLLEKK